MKKENPKLLYLKWNDHWGMGGGWRDIADLKDSGPSICHAIGWLVREDKDGYYLASGLCPESGGPHTNIMYILKTDVKKKQWLRGISLEV